MCKFASEVSHIPLTTPVVEGLCDALNRVDKNVGLKNYDVNSVRHTD